MLAAPGCSLLVFPPLASARSEFALAMSHGSQWPQGQLCGQDSLFLALALALTGHPSWESPLPRPALGTGFPHSLFLTAKSLSNPDSQAMGAVQCRKVVGMPSLCQLESVTRERWLLSHQLPGSHGGQKADVLRFSGHHSLQHNHVIP